ncbi:MAG TPA: hypothetical protein VMS32_07370 [Verrucomicrobiae bacterium]|jgi:hypothetical protein|nr:hypothetical protein [Verrucomicrobiae bacterium]
MNKLQHLAPPAAILTLALLLPLAARADQAPSSSLATPTIRLHADHVAFYYDRFLVEADGNVRITTSDGITMTGDAFSMDLRLNRFLLAGSVSVASRSGMQTGAAVSDFLDYGRIYFIPILSEPDRWTFLDNDFAHPAKGREMPGDAFAFPDLSKNQPYLRANGASIVPRQFVNFHDSVLAFAGRGIAPMGPYYINFSTNRYLAENSLTGATFDGTWQLAGSPNTISAIHFRYDPTNKAYASFEQHVANSRGYAVFSVNPATEDSKFYNLVTGYALTDRLQVQTFTQYHLQQFGFSEPLGGQDVSNVLLTQAFPESSLQFDFEQYNLCNISVYPDPVPSDGPGATYCGVGQFRITNYTHPSQMTLGVTSFDHHIAKTPVVFRWRYGIGNIHDAYTLQNFGNTNYDTIWNHYVGATIFSPTIRLGSREDSQKLYFLNAAIDSQRTWYSVPHHVDVTDGIASLSRTYGPKLSVYLSYEVHQVGDYYNGGQQLVYTPYVPIINGTTYPSYAAFQGIATFRTLSLGATFTPSPDFSLALLARRHRDFPIAEPGEFPSPAPNYPFNTVLYSNTLGEPPYDITGDIRFRVSPTLAVDIQRSYFFNFGNQRWSPSFNVQVSQ